MEKTEQKSGGRGPAGIVKRIFGSFRDGSAEEFFSDMRWIFGYTKKYKWFVVIQILFGVLSASLSLVSAIISKYAIDIVINRKIGSLWLLIAAVAASAVAGLVFSSLQSRVSAKIALRVNNDMRAELFDKLMRADWQGVKKFQSGDILNRLNGDTQTAASIAISWIPSVIVTGFSFASSFVTILFYNVPMAFIALLSAPFLVVVSRGLMKKSRLFHRLVLEKESALMSFETETFCNYDTVKSLGAAESYGERFRCKQEECKTASLDNNLFLIRANILLTVSSYIVSFATFGYCLSLIWHGAISYGTMTFFLQQRARITAGFSSFIKLVPQLLNSAVSAHRVRELSDLPPEPQAETPEQAAELASRPLSLRLTNIDFRYSDDAAVKPVLTRSSFSAEPGEIIAVIGASGQGKTTLLRDLIRQVSDGNRYLEGKTVGVVDERSEIAGSYQGIPQNDLGIRTDILDCCPKAEGMMMLIRSMSPEVVAVDELGDYEDIHAIESVIHCGCKLFATVHGSSIDDMKRKPLMQRLMQEKVFERYIILQNKDRAGQVKAIFDERGTCLYDQNRKKGILC